MADALWNARLFASVYKVKVRDPAHLDYGSRLSYSRHFFHRFADPYFGGNLGDAIPKFVQEAERLNIDTSKRVLVVGCAFGFLVEALMDRGHGVVRGIDNSPYIWTNMAANARSDVLPHLVQADVRDLHAPFRGAFDVVVDEDAICSMDGDQAESDFCTACEAYLAASGEVIHLTTATDDQGESQLRWKNIEEWRAVRSAHTWIRLGGG